ncbi:hypothetical protein FD04_GL000281 [Secundilactobacillus odoratitofui DSM 19909 = JCM 15043]|uniref:D-alanyl carrier protein n=1 Tax=Secundilactobacillus odoratitofui DSM 19909 = JCM 15043 TaxID=1423776 RepID=A0A0R1LRV1_9LACO|nr:D-alanine--poly(phosphoribitol) ligase subunit DltC [Secundilactobacillus odoratitofui]KRK98549.1 hypothetical protein FD04_GL000281 [Secundilactobacillus odoratitofui DSM 19909 = JCM 15043]
MTTQATVIEILNDLTGNDVSQKLDDNLFDTGLLDSMASVQLVIELEERCGVSIPISEFDRSEWDTVNKIVAKVTALQ